MLCESLTSRGLGIYLCLPFIANKLKARKIIVEIIENPILFTFAR
uniref:Uncharacterized protein n=1 Tax=Rhizophora mucronata TaxID=61149 RepID=A0A2P2NAK0_RHIMU